MKPVRTFTPLARLETRFQLGSWIFSGAWMLVLGAFFSLTLSSAAQSPQPSSLDLRPNDHIVLVGNALADRFQHSGWLETYIQARYPNHNLVFRNLAVPGDEIVTRARPENFGSPDDWLKKTQADVIFAFFGFNESFQGPEGLPKFRADLDKFLKDTLAKNYSGKGPPRVVLFSPIANEKHQDPNLPDPSANNANLRLHTDAMREVAAANAVPFVDLFGPSQQFYAEAAQHHESLTVDGLHLTRQADKLIAESIYKSLFGEEVPTGSEMAEKTNLTLTPSSDEKKRKQAGEEYLERVRQAVNEKNDQWHARYRTIDGYNVYGGRSALAYQPGKGGFITDREPPPPYVSNFKVMQEEMSQRDVMTANRDKRVWAVAKGGDLKVEDTNLPPVTKIKSNLPGPNPDQSFPFLGGEEAIMKMKVHPGMKVNLFASEEQFPELIKPVQMAWDTKGRLWVAVWHNYPERAPDSKIGDSLIVLEDTKGTGKADKCTHFIDDLNAPTGFQFYKDGVLVMEAPDLWFARDTNRDGRADWMERVLMGMSSADSHHTANSICYEPGGAVFLSDGVFHRTQVETANGPVRNLDAAIYRYEPRTGKFETYASYGFANPHGRVFDYWGNDLITDATGNNTYFGPAMSGHLDYPAKHESIKEFWDRPSRPCAGTGILTSRHFPPEFQGNFLNCNVIGFQGIYRVKVTEDGSGLKGERLPDLLSSSDPNFRPVAVNVGPDGAIYVCDWQNPIIGHMQHHLRDPNRDHDHGRIYRITYTGRPLMKSPKIDGQPIPALLELLKEPENQIRELAKIELGKRNTPDVIAALNKWAGALDSHDTNYQHQLLEALWVHQWHNVADTDLLNRLLHSPEPRARAAAGRVLCYWRDRVPDALAKFKALADDDNPRVRLEAVRGLSFFRTAEAADAALIVLNHPTDYYLDYVLRETLRQLEQWWRKGLETGQPIAEGNSAGRDYLLSSISTAQLLKLPRSPAVLEAILRRADVADADRMVALGDLAQARNTNLVATLLAELESSIHAGSSGVAASSSPSPRRTRNRRAAVSDSSSNASATLAHLLRYQIPETLKQFRSQLSELTTTGPAEVRENAWAALALADGSFDSVWSEASKSPNSLADLLGGIPFLTDPDLRTKAYDRVKPLVDAPPTENQKTVRQAAIGALVSMNRDPEAIFASLTALIAKGEEVPAAARGLRIVPRPKWPRTQAGAAAAAMVAWAKTVPETERTSESYSEIVQLAEDMTGLMPADAAANVRKELNKLRVALFVVRSVREQMRYDTPRLVVEAGKQFEIIFENGDFMPHNLVVVRPNAREKIGPIAEKMKADEFDRHGRLYVPEHPDILGATKMLLPGQRESLNLKAPSEEGDYEYFCTFPGHYQVMWGRLVITKDVDAYLLAHPEAPLPAATTSSPFEDGTPGPGHGHGH
jgi:glucose/arabinose dehydrogenase/azurin